MEYDAGTEWARGLFTDKSLGGAASDVSEADRQADRSDGDASTASECPGCPHACRCGRVRREVEDHAVVGGAAAGNAAIGGEPSGDLAGGVPSAAPASGHYTKLNPEPIDVIEAWGLNFRLANALKYISRAGRKDPSKTIEDLEKCGAYIRREINWLRGTPGW